MSEELPGDVKSILKEKKVEDIPIGTKYKNHPMETKNRKIIPLGIFCEQIKSPPQDLWLFKVCDKKDYRTYALKDVEEWIKK